MCSIWKNLISNNSWVKIQFEHLFITQFVIFHQFSLTFFCIHIHASELIHFESLSILSYTFLCKENRSRWCYVNCWSNKYKQDSSNQASYQTSGNIHQSFQHQISCRCIVNTGSQYCIISDFFYKLLFPRHALYLCKI